MNKKRENSVRSLSNLYTVVIGVALSVSAVTLVDRQGGIQAIPLTDFFLFMAFIFTLVPFYHGALRHLDDAYLENSNAHIRDGALIVDVFLLFVHGMAFLIMALRLSDPAQFAWILIAVISVDVVWGIFVHFGPSTPYPDGAEGKWAIINLVFVAIAASLLWLNDVGLSPYQQPKKLALLVFVACMLRTLVDYRSCWKFYFPDQELDT